MNEVRGELLLRLIIDRSKCFEKSLNLDNCFGMLALSLRLSCICLTRASRNYILRNFGKLITKEKLEDLINIPFEEIDKIISSDDLNVYKEEQVFEAIIHWTKGNSKDRLSHIGEY